MRRSFKHVSDDLWPTQPKSPTAERFNFGLNSFTDAAAAVRSDKALGVGSPYIRPTQWLSAGVCAPLDAVRPGIASDDQITWHGMAGHHSRTVELIACALTGCITIQQLACMTIQ
jgi:hypothetical protein